MKNVLFLSRILMITLLALLLMNTVGFAQDTSGELTNKLNNLIDKVSLIRDEFQSIAEQLNTTGVPGFELLEEFGDRAKDRLDSLKSKISLLNDLFSLDSVSIPLNNITVSKQHLWNNDWRFKIPEVKLKAISSNNSPNGSPVPKFKPFLLDFLNMLDQPLDNLLESIRALNDSITTNLAIARSHTNHNFSIEEGSFPEAEYWYPDIIRETLGKPEIVLLLKVDYEIWETDARLIEALAEQDISIVGEGGNLGIIKAVNLIVGCIGLVKEIAEHVETLETFDLDVGSYKRLEYIHAEIDTFRTDFKNWTTLSIRTRIEINLAGHGDHPHPIAIFQLPAQFGGYLELARDIVQETIEQMNAAGENVYQAQLFWGRGNNELIAGHYKKAYDLYSQSYNEATK